MFSEKCLPPGTVHLRLQRVVPVAKRLGIDFAPAMVGFEFRNGRSIPIYEGIVVCDEFKGAILEVISILTMWWILGIFIYLVGYLRLGLVSTKRCLCKCAMDQLSQTGKKDAGS